MISGFGTKDPKGPGLAAFGMLFGLGDGFNKIGQKIYFGLGSLSITSERFKKFN